MEMFESIYREHRDAVLRYAIRCVGRRDLAEELTADAFLELHRHWRRIDPGRLPLWLFAVVEKRASRQLRRLGLRRNNLASSVDDEAIRVTDVEDIRIRARWVLRERRWPTYLIVAAAVGGLALAMGPLLRAVAARPTARTVSPPQASSSASTSQTAFVLKKAAIKVPVAAVLTSRTASGDARQFVDDFAAAMDPYEHDEFAEAARRLEVLATTHASCPEAQFYLGVSRLFLIDNSRALEALNAANRLPHESIQADVAWYRAIALDRVGRTAEAKREASALCPRESKYKEQACAAAN